MDQPYIGQIMLFAGTFAPVGWLLCNGQLLSIAEYQALYTIVGTTYGGDGIQTFALPNLQGRIALHAGQGPGLTNRVQGESSGSESVTLTVNQIPAHTHPLFANSGGANATANGNAILSNRTNADGDLINEYSNGAPNTTLQPQSMSVTGGTQPHNNMMPTLVLNYCIATEGIYPTRD